MLKNHIRFMSENGLDFKIVINDELIELMRRLNRGHLEIRDISPDIYDTMMVLDLIRISKGNVFISIQGVAFLGWVDHYPTQEEGIMEFLTMYNGRDYNWYDDDKWRSFEELLIFMRSGSKNLWSMEHDYVDRSGLEELCYRGLIDHSGDDYRLTERGWQASDLLVRSMLIVFDSNYDGSEEMYYSSPFSNCS